MVNLVTLTVSIPVSHHFRLAIWNESYEYALTPSAYREI